MDHIEQTTLLKFPPVLYPALARDILESPRSSLLTEEQRKELMELAEAA